MGADLAARHGAEVPFEQMRLHPALFAAQQFVSAQRSAGVDVAQKLPISTGHMPAGTGLLAAVNSPRMGTLIKLTNTPSDNFFAETLIKEEIQRLTAEG